MKRFKCLFFILVTLWTFQTHIRAVDAVITFFIKEKKSKPKTYRHSNEKMVSQSLSQPSFINAVSKDRSWLNQPGVDGLRASYLGFMATSDKNGQISFPRMQQSDTIYILITPEIEPEFMIKPTLIHNWMTKHNRPTALYEVTRKKNEKLKTYYFEIKRLPVPQDIKENTIIIFAHPNHIEVPIGITVHKDSPNLILPELLAEKVDLAKNSLYTLSIKQYFEQININSSKNSSNIATMITNL